MELAVNRRPFIYFPLKNHCEQVYHVTHHLDPSPGRRRLDYSETPVESLAKAALETLGTNTGISPLHTQGRQSSGGIDCGAIVT